MFASTGTSLSPGTSLNVEENANGKRTFLIVADEHKHTPKPTPKPDSPSLRRSIAVAYTRVSSEKQEANGVGLPGQKAQIDAVAESAGIEIVKRFHDVASARGTGSISKRSGLQQAISASRKLGCPIIVADASRISRDVEDFARAIARKKISIIDASLGWSPEQAAAMMGRIARGQHEVEELSRRTREALQAKKAAGAVLGNRKNLSEAQRRGAAANSARAAERDALLEAEVETLRSAGITGREAIADALNRMGLPAPRGGAWTAASLCRPLRRMRARKALSDLLDPAQGHPAPADPQRPQSSERDDPLWGSW